MAGRVPQARGPAAVPTHWTWVHAHTREQYNNETGKMNGIPVWTKQGKKLIYLPGATDAVTIYRDKTQEIYICRFIRLLWARDTEPFWFQWHLPRPSGRGAFQISFLARGTGDDGDVLLLRILDLLILNVLCGIGTWMPPWSN